MYSIPVEERITIVKRDITQLDTDAVVNAANSALKAGSGVCGAIFQAAGAHRLEKACGRIGHCDTGSAVITPGFDLRAKYIIHAVGPRWTDGEHGERKLLSSAYTRALELAVENGCASVGFPLLSAGAFGCPVQDAWCIALSACDSFLLENRETGLRVVFAVRDDAILREGRKQLKRDVPWFTKLPAERDDLEVVLDLPEQTERFVLRRHFTGEELDALRCGCVPESWDDRWFAYMEGNTLYIHSSRSGICLYAVEIRQDDNHVVTVNRDPEQYKVTDLAHDEQMVDKLLQMLARPRSYCFYWEAGDFGFSHDPDLYAAVTGGNGKKNVLRETLSLPLRKTEAVFFRLPDGQNGFLSNWYPSPFTVDGVPFTSVEQYLAYEKCLRFGFLQAAARVRNAEDIRIQRKIAGNIPGYVSSVWAGMRQAVLMRGLMAKFSQNETLKQQLLDTGDAYLVKCSATDRVWGCGRASDDDRRLDAASWDGTNLLGFALMEVRRMLK